MLFSVVQTRRLGVRLSREEIEAVAPAVGRLKVEDWREGNSCGRALRLARLLPPLHAFAPELLLPLFDPVMVRMTDAGFLLTGFQIEALADGRAAEHGQGWWVRSVEAGGNRQDSSES